MSWRGTCYRIARSLAPSDQQIVENFLKILKAGALYFALIFGAGFVLGTIRTFWAVPRFGSRTAELLEMPGIFVVNILTARWIVKRLFVPPTLFARLTMGGVALALLLVAEFSLVLWLRGLSLEEYFANRDPVSGTVYYVMLLVFALMPVVVSRNGPQTSRRFKTTPAA